MHTDCEYQDPAFGAVTLNWGILPSVVWFIAVSFLGFNPLRSLNTVLGWPVLSPNVAVAAARRTCRRTFRFSYCKRAFEPRRALTQARCGVPKRWCGAKKVLELGKVLGEWKLQKSCGVFVGFTKQASWRALLVVRWVCASQTPSHSSLSFSSTFPLFSLSLSPCWESHVQAGTPGSIASA